MNGGIGGIDFILADMELVGTKSWSFDLSFAKYITFCYEIVAQLSILSREFLFLNLHNYI
jgi:hypothetical protein